jgi:hypothetical protein
MWQCVGIRAALVAVLLAGCATAEPPPPTGSMWAFFTDSEVTLGPRAVVYTISQVACEIERRRRAAPASCVRVIVSPGSGYHAIALPIQFDASLPGGGIGTLDRDRCERLRMDLFRTFSAMGDCRPVAVTPVP